MVNLFQQAQEALAAQSIDDKSVRTRALQQSWREGSLSLIPQHAPSLEPGRPEQPKLVHPRQLKRRSLHTENGRRAFIHALAHIEFNAINLALDAVCRFQAMPVEYYSDWLQVATEESLHFELLSGRLRELGMDYGDLPAHDGLWDMARRTAHDPLPRMALVPRVMEARGLDVTPGMIEQLQIHGDNTTAAILEIIYRDEIGHVAIGSRWFGFLCQLRGLAVEPTFRRLSNNYFRGQLRGPFNRQARLQAGFSNSELDALEAEN